MPYILSLKLASTGNNLLHFLLLIPDVCLNAFFFKTNFVHAMDFELLNLYSVTCLELYLTRKGEAHQTCKQTWQQLRIHSLNNIMVINFILDFSWVLFLKESACNSLQKQKHQPFLHWCLESINSKLMLSEHNTQLL